jgi:hypothetical protein
MNISEMVVAKMPQIKKLLFSEKTAEAFVDAKLVDGTIVRYDALEVGAALSVVGEDGEIVAAPDGEHELESGEIVRTEEGVIVEILEAEPVDAEEEERRLRKKCLQLLLMLTLLKRTSWEQFPTLSNLKSLRLHLLRMTK